MTSAPMAAQKLGTATRLPAPLPQSTTTFTGRARRNDWPRPRCSGDARRVSRRCPPRGEVDRSRSGAQALDARAVRAVAHPAHLDAVVLGRVVRARDLDARVRVAGGGRIVEHRRGNGADVDHVRTGRAQIPRSTPSASCRRAGAVVAAQRPRQVVLAASRCRRNSLPKARPIGLGDVAGQVARDDPADVVFAKDMLAGFITMLSRSALPSRGIRNRG